MSDATGPRDQCVALAVDRCPTCRCNWELFKPVKCAGSDHYRCIECKAVYAGHMIHRTTATRSPATGAREDRLSPCPFCGSKAEIARQGTSRQSMIVACTYCGCRVESGDIVGLTPPKEWRWNVRRSYSPAQDREAAQGTVARMMHAHGLREGNWSGASSIEDVATEIAIALTTPDR